MPAAIVPAAAAAASCVEHFVRVIQGREPLCATAEQGLVLTRIIQAIYDSARTGTTICFR